MQECQKYSNMGKDLIFKHWILERSLYNFSLPNKSEMMMYLKAICDSIYQAQYLHLFFKQMWTEFETKRATNAI